MARLASKPGAALATKPKTPELLAKFAVWHCVGLAVVDDATLFAVLPIKYGAEGRGCHAWGRFIKKVLDRNWIGNPILRCTPSRRWCYSARRTADGVKSSPSHDFFT